MILTTNANRVLPDWFASGRYEGRPSLATIANAMDVGDPSNAERLAWLFDHYAHARAGISAETRYRKFKRPFRRVCRVGGGRASGGLGKDRACASALRHHLGAQSGRPWPFLTESRPFDRLRTGVGPNAPLRDRRRI